MSDFVIRLLFAAPLLGAFGVLYGFGSSVSTAIMAAAAFGGAQGFATSISFIRRKRGGAAPYIGVVVAPLVALGTLGVFIYLASTRTPPPPPYLMIDEITPAMTDGSQIKAHGYVVANTIETKPGGGVAFVIANKGKRLRVAYAGARPELLRDGMELVATGTYTHASSGADPSLVASDIAAKCPTNYDRGSGQAPPQYR